MPKSTETVALSSPSLVPRLEEEEKKLQELLEAARTEAAGIVEKARTEAARRIKAAEAAPIESRPPEPGQTESRPSPGAEADSASGYSLEIPPDRMDEAVQFIISKVWPGDES